MKTSTKKSVNPGSIIIIVIIFIIYLLIAMWSQFQNYRQYIYDNWSEYKCNPLIIPMASYYNPEVSTGKNFNTCLTEMQLLFFNILLAPLYNILNLLQGMILKILDVFNSLRGQISMIRSRVQAYIEKIIQKFQGLETNLRLFIIKLKSMVGKIEGILTITEYTFIVISMALEWIFNVPGIIALVTIVLLIILSIMICLFFPIACALLGVLAAGVGLAYCFDENTLIKTDDNNYVRISDLKVGQSIFLGGKVTSIIKSKHNNDLYNYRGILVSGNHLVYEYKNWKHVKDSLQASKINYSKPYVYCLTTQNNLITTNNNIIFRDFNETNHPQLNCLFNNLIVNYLNRNKKSKQIRKINSKLEIMPCGFSGETSIETADGRKYIRDLPIGYQLNNNSVIIAKIKLSSENIVIYDYKGLLVSASNVVFENGKWIRVYESSLSIKVSTQEKYLYHLGTSNQEISINGLKFKDYHEITQCGLSHKIDNTILTYLNEGYKFKK